MTESEWLSSTDPAAMLAWLTGQAPIGRPPDTRPRREALGVSVRRLRLFAEAAGCRSCRILSAGRGNSFWADSVSKCDSCGPPERKAHILRDVFNPFRPVRFDRACFTCEGRGEIPIKEPPYVHVMIPRFAACRSCDGTGRIDWDKPSWLTNPIVRAIALDAYAERAGMACGRCGGTALHDCGDGLFRCEGCNCTTRTVSDGTLDPHRLGVLADAAEDAGLEDAEILNHLRGKERAPGDWHRCKGCGVEYRHVSKYSDCGNAACEGMGYEEVVRWQPLRGPHVAGCWCVDLLLGKS
jgi:hypothetical protein